MFQGGQAESLGRQRRGGNSQQRKVAQAGGALERNKKTDQHMKTRACQAGVNPGGLWGPTRSLQPAGNRALCHEEGNNPGAGTDRPEQAFLIRPAPMGGSGFRIRKRPGSAQEPTGRGGWEGTQRAMDTREQPRHPGPVTSLSPGVRGTEQRRGRAGTGMEQGWDRDGAGMG